MFRMIYGFMASLGVVGAFGIVALWLAGIYGWVANIVKLVGMLGDPTLTPMFIARIAGVPLAPLGAVLGWF